MCTYMYTQTDRFIVDSWGSFMFTPTKCESEPWTLTGATYCVPSHCDTRSGAWLALVSVLCLFEELGLLQCTLTPSECLKKQSLIIRATCTPR